MTVKRLVYVANARLPTEKAHGYQICKMCEALSLAGVDVRLIHPVRHQVDARLRRQSVFEYYGVRQIFEVAAAPNLDVMRLETVLPRPAMRGLFFAHSVAWGLHAAIRARADRADLYYTREAVTAYWLTRLGQPTVYEAHTVPGGGQGVLLRRTFRRRRGLRLIAPLTSFIAQRLIGQGAPADRVLILPDAVDLGPFQDLPSREECRRRLGLPLDRVLIGYVGRFQTMDMEKGIRELLAAVGQLDVLGGREPLLVCVGGPMDAVPGYVDVARRAGVPEHLFRFVDRVPNTIVPSWTRAFDVVTIPWPWTEFSAYFTSPMKLFEYMASGTPIVASDLPAMREVLRHGETAFLVEPGDAGALARGITDVLRDAELGGRLSRNARTAVEGYTWNRRARRLLDCLDDQAA
jgi:glycosyltransferase involved in cell wall biosynthesis